MLQTICTLVYICIPGCIGTVMVKKPHLSYILSNLKDYVYILCHVSKTITGNMASRYMGWTNLKFFSILSFFHLLFNLMTSPLQNLFFLIEVYNLTQQTSLFRDSLINYPIANLYLFKKCGQANIFNSVWALGTQPLFNAIILINNNLKKFK